MTESARKVGTSAAGTLAAWLGYVVVRALASTYRFRFQGTAPVPAPAGCAAYILAIWHQNLFAGILAQTGRRHVVIVSRSRDGEPVSALCRRLGHHVARGSSKKGDIDKGGKEAKDEMIDMLRAGVPGALTVDGPRGPAHVVKPGIIEMARATGLPIVPYLPLPSRYWALKSWDAFRLPKPFARIDIHYGAPVHVPADTAFAAFAHYQQLVASALDGIEDAPPVGACRSA
ncbi:MAG: lysophospholipid acyltransferase family protein [Sinimarinibacterium sp.]